MYNQQHIIISRGESLEHIYKLTHGTVSYLDHQGKQYCRVQAPCYLNRIETIFSCSLIKTIRAFGRCQVVKVALKDSHKNVVKQNKQQGIRKSRFTLFDNISLPLFYELVQFGILLQHRKHEIVELKQNCLFVIIKGKICISGKEPLLKLVQLEQGQTFISLNSTTTISTLSSNIKILEIEQKIVKGVLGKSYQELEKQLLAQSNSLQPFKIRNQRLSHQIRKKPQQNVQNIPKEFANVVELKAKGVQKYCRAKSCLGHHKSRNQIQSDNANLFKQTLEHNSKIYGHENVFFKRIQSINKIHSLSCASTPSNECQKSTSLTDIIKNIYRTFSQKQKKNGLQTKILIKRWQTAKPRDSKIKKKARADHKQNIFEKIPFSNTKDEPQSNK